MSRYSKLNQSQKRIFRGLYLFEAIVAGALGLFLVLVAIEGLSGWNVLPGADASWFWQPIAQYWQGILIYLLVIAVSFGWMFRRLYLFKHPEKESSFRF